MSGGVCTPSELPQDAAMHCLIPIGKIRHHCEEYKTTMERGTDPRLFDELELKRQREALA